MTTTVAAFDVDGTLTDRDCVVPFMRRVTGAPRVAGRLAARPDRLLPVLARRDRDELKSLAAAAAFRGRRIDDLERAGTAFARFVHENWLRADTIARLDEHRAQGHIVVLVSASFEVYLRPLGRLLGVDDVLATRLMVRDGVATGALEGVNCRGPEKVHRLHSWLDQRLGTGDPATDGRAHSHVVAYGDSAGDREMLADADDARWVTATRAMRATRSSRTATHAKATT
ncbi:HAD-IB family hydrolase [Ilumatobacter sp.]|uniref:HAD-IB family hydrolase n=1 Tax=Ilumatobacter sp. TaxID=1967498 RepID=UPI003C46CDA6